MASGLRRQNVVLRSLTVGWLCASLAACQTPEGGGQNSFDGRISTRNRASLVSQTDDYRRTIVEGTVSGALIGGVGAALVTAVAGGDGRAVGRNALIGAAVGGLIGTAAGKGVADRKQDYVEREDDLGATIRQAEANNAKLARMVSTAQSLLRERRSQAAQLSAKDAAARRALSSAIGGDQRAIASAVAASQRDVAQLESLKSRYSRDASIDRQINEKRQQQRKLENVSDDLDGIKETIR